MMMNWIATEDGLEVVRREIGGGVIVVFFFFSSFSSEKRCLTNAASLFATIQEHGHERHDVRSTDGGIRRRHESGGPGYELFGDVWRALRSVRGGRYLRWVRLQRTTTRRVRETPRDTNRKQIWKRNANRERVQETTRDHGESAEGSGSSRSDARFRRRERNVAEKFVGRGKTRWV